ncbi:succinate--CoA ligase [ADP-forming] subunit alpha [Tenuifilaceae bacterium CYCD]|nr:succinate--CoA ligase [ADP-forming] subunit alpha [Tenuifilaceae bacterium CYCD]
MSVGLTDTSRIVVQGITGKEGSLHAELCLDYGTNIVAGVSPGKGGTKFKHIPVYNTIAESVEINGANVSLIFVPSIYACDAILESVFAGIKTIICITEGIPVHDMIKVKRIVDTYKVTLIGPNCPGIIVPGLAKAGIMPGHIFKKGKIGMISRSGTLLYEAADQVVRSGLGISTALGIGGDPIVGTDYMYWLNQFEANSETDAIVLIGEIGGDMEERAAAYIKKNIKKPVFAFIAGRSAPQGKRMGHAGAIIMGNTGTVESKDAAFTDAGITVITQLAQIGKTIHDKLIKI